MGSGRGMKDDLLNAQNCNLLPLTCPLNARARHILFQKMWEENSLGNPVSLKEKIDLYRILASRVLPYLLVGSFMNLNSHVQLPLQVCLFHHSPSLPLSQPEKHPWLYPFPPFPHLDNHQILTFSSCHLHLFLPKGKVSP